jgi:hypothetical protein
LVAAGGALVAEVERREHAHARAQRGQADARTALEDRIAKGKLETEQLAERIAALNVTRAAVETDRATVQDLALDSPIFVPHEGKVFELYQLHPNGAAASLLRVPFSAPLVEPSPSVERMGDRARVTAIAGVEPLYGSTRGLVAVASTFSLPRVYAAPPRREGWLIALAVAFVACGACVAWSARRARVSTGRRRDATAFDPKPANTTPATSRPAIVAVGRDFGALVGSRYRIFRQLGGDLDSPILLALSVPSAGNPEEVAIRVFEDVDAAAARRFADGARALLGVRHANLVTVRDFGGDRGTCFLVMEYVEGWSLAGLTRELRRTGDRMPLGHVLTIGRDLCRGLTKLHEATDPEGRSLHLLHGAVGARNVIIGRGGVVKLGGYPIASPRSLPPADLAAPEQLHHGAAPDPRSDVYGVARLLCELASPAAGAWTTMTAVHPHDPQSLLEGAELPRGVRDVLARALAFDPAVRPSSCAELGSLLAGLPLSKADSESQAAVLSEWAEGVRHLSHVIVSMERPK